MPDTNLRNQAAVEGVYNGEYISLLSNEVVTDIPTELTIAKIADKLVWNEGPLTYTVNITNSADHPFTSLTFSDTLDPAIVTYINGSFTIDNVVAPVTYDSATGLLSAALPDMAISDTHSITFQVKKA